jgi:hypothetical protein
MITNKAGVVNSIPRPKVSAALEVFQTEPFFKISCFKAEQLEEEITNDLTHYRGVTLFQEPLKLAHPFDHTPGDLLSTDGHKITLATNPLDLRYSYLQHPDNSQERRARLLAKGTDCAFGPLINGFQSRLNSPRKNMSEDRARRLIISEKLYPISTLRTAAELAQVIADVACGQCVFYAATT